MKFCIAAFIWLLYVCFESLLPSVVVAKLLRSIPIGVELVRYL